MAQTKDGLPASAFLVVGDPSQTSTWHLPVKDSSGKPDHRLMAACKAALGPSGFRGNRYDGPDKDKALSKLKALYASEGMEFSEDDESQQFQDPTAEDLHVPALIGAHSSSLRGRVGRLMDRIRGHYTAKDSMSQDEMHQHLTGSGLLDNVGHTNSPTDGEDDPEDRQDGGADEDTEDQKKKKAQDDTDAQLFAGPGSTHVKIGDDEYLYVLPLAFDEDAPDWVQTLPLPGHFEHTEYGDIDIPEQRNRNFIQNFKAGVYQSKVPVTIGHARPGETLPAVGWITDLRLASDGRPEGKVQWNERGRAAIKNKEFGYVSPEWYDTWKHPATGQVYTDILKGLALVNHPYFKETHLRPLVASEFGLTIPPGTTFTRAGKEGTMPDDQNGQGQTDEQKSFAELEAENKKFAEERAELQRQLAEARKATESTDAERRQFEEMAKQAHEKVIAMERQNRRQAFAEEVKAGGWFGNRDKHVSFMEKLADSGDEEQLAFYRETNRAYAEQIAQGEVFKKAGMDTGPEPGSAADELQQKVRALQAAEPTLEYHRAYARIVDSDPKLAKRVYVEEHNAS